MKEKAMYSISIYLDDFIGTAVKNVSGTLLGRIITAFLHVIHIIPPLPPPKSLILLGGKIPSPWGNSKN